MLLVVDVIMNISPLPCVTSALCCPVIPPVAGTGATRSTFPNGAHLYTLLCTMTTLHCSMTSMIDIYIYTLCGHRSLRRNQLLIVLPLCSY